MIDPDPEPAAVVAGRTGSWWARVRRRWWSWARGVRTAPPARLSDGDRRLLSTEWDQWHRLDAAERARMERLISAFVATTRFEAAKGFELERRHRILVAAQASLLLLGLDLDEFPATGSVIVHPRTVVLRGRRGTGVGRVETSGPYHVAGQAHFRGPVLLSWPAVRDALRHPERGHNVVLHEFAHQLDMLDGGIDGTPPIEDPELHGRWVEVCTEVFGAVRERVGPPVLRAYAGTDPGEFFAVATEVFFTRPVHLRAQAPELYDVFAGYFGQDPVRRFPEVEAPEWPPDDAG